MNSDFSLATHKTVHVGAKREYTTYSWDEWHRRYTPRHLRCLTYKKVNDKMVDIKEEVFVKGERSIIPHIDSIIILEWRDDDLNGKANSFLNNCLPIDKAQRFHDGIVGLGVGRWLQALFMNLITKSESERPIVMKWFCDLVEFVAGLTRLRDADKFFGVVRTTLEINDKVEDILVYRLLQTILQVRVPRQRMFRWFELSIQRAFKRHAHLKDAMLTPMVWLYTDLVLNKDMPMEEAIHRSFDQLMTIASYTDEDIMRSLLRHVFPEIPIPKTGEILKAVHDKEPWSDDRDTVFSDGSMIGRRIAEMPYGIRAISGTVGLAPGHDDAFIMNTAEYNNYTPFMIRLPEVGTEFQLTVHAVIISPDRTSRFGPGLICRSFKDYARTSKDFQGHMGLTLIGGRGNGKTAPTSERTKPTYLLQPPGEVEMEIATMRVSQKSYQLSAPTWSSPLEMIIPSDHRVFAVFVKGMRNIRIRVQSRMSIPPPPPPPPIAETSSRFSELVARARTVA